MANIENSYSIAFDRKEDAIHMRLVTVEQLPGASRKCVVIQDQGTSVRILRQGGYRGL